MSAMKNKCDQGRKPWDEDLKSGTSVSAEQLQEVSGGSGLNPQPLPPSPPLMEAHF